MYYQAICNRCGEPLSERNGELFCRLCNRMSFEDAGLWPAKGIIWGAIISFLMWIIGIAVMVWLRG